ncbi:MAG: tetratricopeptide repeat protein [Aquabacterium sp.]
MIAWDIGAHGTGTAATVAFIVAATLLVAAFSATLLHAAAPRGAADPAPPTRRGLLLWVLLLPLAVGLLYAWQGEPRALRQSAPPDGAAMAASVQRLGERLAREPGDLDGWLMLARSHNAMGRHEQALPAYARLRERAWAEPELLVEWIETRLLADDRRIDDESQALIARAMVLAPTHPDVLLLAGLAAMERGDSAGARAALRPLRAHHPEGSDDRLAIDHALARLDADVPPRPPPGAAAGPKR